MTREDDNNRQIYDYGKLEMGLLILNIKHN